jgi:hypothetical protein
MMSKKWMVVLSGFALLVILSQPVMALLQAQICPEIVRTAVALTETVCSETSRDQACYGHNLVQINAQFGSDSDLPQFTAPGDRVPLSDIQSIELSAMDAEQGLWGVSLMRLRAAAGQESVRGNITLLAFGDVFIQNAAEDTPTLELSLTNSTDLPIHVLPTADSSVLNTLSESESILATGRLDDDSWVRVQLDSGVTGWLARESLPPRVSLETLDIVEADSRYYEPMQAIFFRSNDSGRTCADIPDSGLLIQTAEGVGQVRMTINGVDIDIGSTAYVQAQPNQGMTVSLLEGHASLTAHGMTQELVPGTHASVALDENLNPLTVPGLAVANDPETIDDLPLELLDRPVDPEAEIAALQAQSDANNGNHLGQIENGNNGNHVGQIENGNNGGGNSGEGNSGNGNGNGDGDGSNAGGNSGEGNSGNGNGNGGGDGSNGGGNGNGNNGNGNGNGGGDGSNGGGNGNGNNGNGNGNGGGDGSNGGGNGNGNNGNGNGNGGGNAQSPVDVVPAATLQPKR